MRPFDAFHDPRNCAAGYAILYTKGPIPYASGIALSYPANICCGQPCSIVVFPAMIVVRAAASLSAFADLVCGIVLVRSKEEVVGPDARGIVAFVTDEQPIWDGAEVQFPGKAVRHDPLSICEKLSVSENTLSGALVSPAVRSLLHPLPEPFFRQPHASDGRTRLTAKSRSSAPDMRRLRMILRAAVEAVNRQRSHSRIVTQMASAMQDWATA